MTCSRSSRPTSGINSTSAPSGNSGPITEACSNTRRSTAGRRSTRVASSDWIVGGTSTASRSTASSQRSSCCAITPSSTSMRINSRTNSGLPSVELGNFAVNSAGSTAPPSSSAASSSVAAASRPSNDTTSATRRPVSARAGRMSRSSGRANATIITGAVFDHSARCSSRSRNNGSAHWMSSITNTNGRCPPSTSTRRRTPKNASSVERGRRGSDESTQQLDHPVGVVLAADEIAKRRDDLLGGVAVVETRHLLEQVDDRRERRGSRALTADLDHVGVASRSRAQLAREAGLADTR